MPTPRAIVILLTLALNLALVGGAVWLARQAASAKADATAQAQRVEAIKAELAAARQETALARQNVRVVTEYVDRVQTVQLAGKTITKEVPVYVTAQADAACTVPAGFVRIHDAAAGNAAPQPTAGDPDAPATGITLSAVADTVANNYTQYHALAAQLIGLQDYVAASCPAAQEGQ